MTPRLRNDIVKLVFENITAEGEFFLGFTYDEMKQSGRCNCVNTGFIRIPKFTVVHKKAATILYFRTHHGDTERIQVKNPEIKGGFQKELTDKIKTHLEKYQNDWD